MPYSSPVPLTDQQLKQSLYAVTLMAFLLPPFLGGSIMAFLGFYPLPAFYQIFFSYTGIYVLAALLCALALVPRVFMFFVEAGASNSDRDHSKIHRIISRLPWLFLVVVTVYSNIGVVTADFSLEAIGIADYVLRDHIYHQLGVIPVVLITVMPITFYFSDRLGLYLGPREVAVAAIPMVTKIILLGFVTPLLIGSMLIAYYFDRTGYFSIEALAFWCSVLMLSAGVTWTAKQSFMQSLEPVRKFIAGRLSESPGVTFETLKSVSLDELGILTNELARSLEAQQQLSDALSRTQEMTDAILENAGVLIVVLDGTGKIQRFNRASEIVSGLTFAEVSGKFPWDTFLPPEDAEKIRQSAFEPIMDGGSEELKYTNYWKTPGDGRALIEWVNTTLLDSQGNVTTVISIGMDITDRKRSQDLIEKSEQRLKEAQRIAKIGYWELDLTSNNLIWSDEIFNMFEIDQKRFTANYDDFLAAIHPEDRDRVNQAYSDSLVNRTDYKITHRIQMPDGRIKHVREACESQFDDAGEPIRSMGTVQDITELYRTEEELSVLASIVRNSSDFIGIANIDGVPIFLNSAGREMVGLGSDEDLRKTLVPDFFPPDESKKVTNEILPSVLSTGRWAGEINFRHFTNNESIPVWFDIFRVDHIETGEPTHFATITRDIRLQKLTEAELKRYRSHLEELVMIRTLDMKNAQEEAERASMAKTDFLSRMSHEFRTPLNAILGFGQLLQLNQASPLNEDQLQNVTQILTAGDHLLSLVNEVLDLSSIESGYLHLDLQAVEVAPIVNACISQVRPLADAREITISVQPAEVCTIIADELRLKEILLNLLSNAIKFNRVGGSVVIDCSHVKPGWLRVNVHDTGRGIDPDAMQHLFVPFERLSSSYDGIEGTGIGLALVRKLVEAMQGDLGVESEPDKGSTFWFELPEAEITAKKPKPATDLLSKPSSGSYKVLYVEDNPANLLMAQKALVMRDDIELLDATSAEAGLEIVRNTALDLILLDINLPGMNGYEALQLLRADSGTRHIPVIAVSANAMPSDLAQAEVAGFDEYLVKPINLHKFYRVIDDWLQRAK